MTCFVIAMAMYPEKQALAKAELDQLLCGTRLPTIDDRGSLPYIEALINETLRWHIALPFSESSIWSGKEGFVISRKMCRHPTPDCKGGQIWRILYPGRDYHLTQPLVCFISLSKITWASLNDNE